MPENYIGEITPFGGNFAIRGWALCDGQLLPISSYSALFSILGTTYGGDGVSTFALPDLQGRVALHMGQGAGLTYRTLGAKSGTETVTLTTNQMPAHSHAYFASPNDNTQAVPTGNALPSVIVCAPPPIANSIVSAPAVAFAAVMASRSEITPSLPGVACKLAIEEVSPSSTSLAVSTVKVASKRRSSSRSVSG